MHIPFPNNVKMIKCGGFHSICILGNPNTTFLLFFNYISKLLQDNGDLYSWGENTCGQLGLGDNQLAKDSPQKIPKFCSSNVASFCCGWQHTVVLSGKLCFFSASCVFIPVESGAVYTCGDNRLGELGLGDLQNRNSLELVSALAGVKIVSISCESSFHSGVVSGICCVQTIFNTPSTWRNFFMGL